MADRFSRLPSLFVAAHVLAEWKFTVTAALIARLPVCMKAERGLWLNLCLSESITLLSFPLLVLFDQYPPLIYKEPSPLYQSAVKR
uniref:Uncharacterized protein n=1 Tax=Anguilla anguilla TaxID=7936 RepID=A0A0E9PER2_ANGAN